MSMLGGCHEALKEFQLPEPKETIFIGDSHILCFEHTGQPILEYSGSSIHGLVNPNSKSGARNKILEHLQENQYKQVIFMFGKVDLEWVYPYKKSIDPSLTINDWITTVTKEYLMFLQDVMKINSNITVLGIHPPSLDDHNMLNRINSKHSINVVCNQATMTEQDLIVKNIDPLFVRNNTCSVFNKIIENLVKELGLTYLPPPQSLFDENGMVNKTVIVYGDHHLDRIKAGNAWLNQYPEIYR